MSLQFNIPEAEFRSRAKRIKALVFDLDDTLLNSEKNIPEPALHSIRALQKAGVFVSICTARNCSAAQYYAQQLDILGVYSAVSGCQLVDGQTGTLVSSHAMQNEDAIRLVEFCLEHNLPFSLSIGSDGYVGGPLEPDSDPIKRRLRQKKTVVPGYSMKKLTDPGILRGASVYKIVVHTEGAYPLLSGFIHKNISSAQCAITSKGIINIFPAGYNKGAGIIQIAEQMNISPAEFCTFGDFWSDVPMFEVSGLSVAMGNAKADVRKKASAVTEAADQDGIALVLNSVFLTG